MDQRSQVNKSQKSLRPPSVNSNKNKNKNNRSSVQHLTSVNLQTQSSKSKRSVTPLKAERSSVNDNSKIRKKEKLIKIDASMNSMNDKEDVALIDLMREKANSTIEPKNEKNSNQSFIKNENFDVKVNLNYGSEIKMTPNITKINKLINNSQEVLNEQRNILDTMTELNKKLFSSEVELQRQASKAESDDFNNSAEKYLSNLNEVVERLKCHSEEMDNLKAIREENKNLRYKLELMNIDKKDLSLGIEAKLTSQKNFLTNELNTLNELLADLGFDTVSPKLTSAEFDEDSISLYFQNLKKLLRNNKIKFSENDNRINCLVVDKQSLEEEIKFFKSKVENIHKKTIQSDPNLQVLIKQQYEEELNHYKNQVKELQMQLHEVKYKNKEISSSDNNNNNNNVNLNNANNPRSEYHSKLNNQDNNRPSYFRNGHFNNNVNEKSNSENKNYEKYFERRTYDNNDNDNNNNNNSNDFSSQNNNNLKNNNNNNNDYRNYSENRNYRNNIYDSKKTNNYDNSNKNIFQRYGNNNRDIQFGSYEEPNSNQVRHNNSNHNYNELSQNYEDLSNTNNFGSQNNTLDNFRRLKDTRTSVFNQTNNLSNNPNSSVFNSNEIKLENKYSDSNFYKPDNTLFNSNNYDYSNNYNQ